MGVAPAAWLSCPKVADPHQPTGSEADLSSHGKKRKPDFKFRNTNQPTYLPFYRPTYLPFYLPNNQPTNQPTYLPSYLPTNQPTYLPTNLRSRGTQWKMAVSRSPPSTGSGDTVAPVLIGCLSSSQSVPTCLYNLQECALFRVLIKTWAAAHVHAPAADVHAPALYSTPLSFWTHCRVGLTVHVGGFPGWGGTEAVSRCFRIDLAVNSKSTKTLALWPIFLSFFYPPSSGLNRTNHSQRSCYFWSMWFHFLRSRSQQQECPISSGGWMDGGEMPGQLFLHLGGEPRARGWAAWQNFCLFRKKK